MAEIAWKFSVCSYNCQIIGRNVKFGNLCGWSWNGPFIALSFARMFHGWTIFNSLSTAVQHQDDWLIGPHVNISMFELQKWEGNNMKWIWGCGISLGRTSEGCLHCPEHFHWFQFSCSWKPLSNGLWEQVFWVSEWLLNHFHENPALCG